MPKLTPEEKALLGPLIDPFGRNTRKPLEAKKPKDGETDQSAFEHLIHNGENDGEPKQFVRLTAGELQELKNNSGKYPEKCFLWVLDEDTIKIIREKNRNTLRTHKPEFVCHTNLTGNGQAYLGGEIYFCEDGRIFINTYSDRYGDPHSEIQWETAKKYIEKVGYTPLLDILDFLTN